MENTEDKPMEKTEDEEMEITDDKQKEQNMKEVQEMEKIVQEE